MRKSLVVASRTADTVRYSLLETIRQFAEYELADTGGLDEARDRHAAWFGREVMARWEVWNGPGFHDAVGWVATEFANLRAAFRWSVARDDLETAADVAAHAAMIGVSTELFEAVGWVEEIIDAAAAADIRRLPRVYTAAGYSCFTGRPEAGVAHAQLAQRLEADPRYDAFDSGWAMFIEALAQVYCGRLDDYLELTRRVAALPGSARAHRPARVRGWSPGDRTGRRGARARGGGRRRRAHLRQPVVDRVCALGARVGVRASRSLPARSCSGASALEYVQRDGITFFEGFIARDAALLQLADAVPAESIDLFGAAIDSFRRSGNVAQLGITVASVTSLFDRIDAPEAAATLYGAITGAAGGDHHLPRPPRARGPHSRRRWLRTGSTSAWPTARPWSSAPPRSTRTIRSSLRGRGWRRRRQRPIVPVT